MSFSLYRCGHDTYVIVPEALSPPIEAIRRYGNATFVRKYPRHQASSTTWDRIVGEIETELYAAISIEEMEEILAGDQDTSS